MPVLIGRLEQIDLNCLIWVGRVTRSDALDLPGRIDPSRTEFGPRWISYFDQRADLSDLDAACLIALRERLKPVISGLAAKGEFKMMLVSNSTYNDPLLAAWRAMTATDAAYPSNPVFVQNIDAASRALGLSAAEAEDARLWIASQIERFSADPA